MSLDGTENFEGDPSAEFPPSTPPKKETAPKGEKLKLIDQAIRQGLLAGFEILRTTVNTGRRVPEIVHRTLLNTAADQIAKVTKVDMTRNRPFRIDDDIEVKENPNRRSYFEIVKEGIEDFQAQHPDIPVFWQEQPDRASVKTFISLLGKRYASLSFQPGKEVRVIDKLINSTIEKKNFNAEVGVEIRSLFPPEIIKVIGAAEYSDVRPFFKQSESELMGTVREKINELIEKSKNPLPSSTILSICLEYTEGNLSSGLYLLSEIFKEAAGRLEDKDIEDISWLSGLVLDEYSHFTPYDQLPNYETAYFGKIGKGISARLRKKFGINPPPTSYHTKKFNWDPNSDRIPNFDFSKYNMEGEPYHAAHIAALLNQFSPEMVLLMVVGEYIQYGIHHGLHKFLSDLRVLADLRRIEKLFESYKPQPATHSVSATS